MASTMSLLKGIGVGAGLMYVFDPDQGRRRRSLVRDQIVGAFNGLEEGLDAAWRDVRNRFGGLTAERTGSAPGLQGGAARRGASSDLTQASWSPGARLLVGIAGATLVLSHMRRGGLTGTVFGAVGAGMLARAVSNVAMTRLMGLKQEEPRRSAAEACRITS
jgi:hypothetical protein